MDGTFVTDRSCPDRRGEDPVEAIMGIYEGGRGVRATCRPMAPHFDVFRLYLSSA